MLRLSHVKCITSFVWEMKSWVSWSLRFLWACCLIGFHDLLGSVIVIEIEFVLYELNSYGVTTTSIQVYLPGIILIILQLYYIIVTWIIICDIHLHTTWIPSPSWCMFIKHWITGFGFSSMIESMFIIHGLT